VNFSRPDERFHLEQSRFAFNCKQSDQFHDPDGAARCAKAYDQAFVETPALRGASLQVERGAIFGLLGPNGAGKTTLLSILATLLLPDRGSATILGHDVVREAFAIRRRLNMASGNASFVWSLRPAEVLAFYGRLYGLHGRTLRARVAELLDRFELTPHLKTEYNELSTGLKQRLALAKALLNRPEVLFLDEPTLGLDPDVSIRIRAQIAELRRREGTTIILTTHYMREADELCDRIAFIKGGRILAEGSPDELKRQIRIGDVVAVTITYTGANSLFGELARTATRDAAAPELASLET